MLAGAGVYRIGRWLVAAARRRELIVLPGVAACLCALLLQLHAQHNERLPVSRAYNFGGPAFYVGAHARRGDGLLFLSSFYRKAELGYPAQFRRTADFALAVSPAASASYQGINKPFDAIRPLLLSYRQIWVIGKRRPGTCRPGHCARKACCCCTTSPGSRCAATRAASGSPCGCGADRTAVSRDHRGNVVNHCRASAVY
jgi:hypothetical protein